MRSTAIQPQGRPWRETKLKYLARGQVQMGPFGTSLAEAVKHSPAPFRVYGQENTISGDFTIGQRWIDTRSWAELSRYAIAHGDFVFTRKGSLGHCRIVPAGIEPGIFDSDTIRVRVRESEADRSFLLYSLRESEYVSSQLDSTKRGAILSGLNTSTIGNLRLGLPTLQMQRAVAVFLDRKTAAIDGLIAKKERLIELLEEKRQALITQAVTKGLNPNVPMKDSGIEWLGEMPTSWQIFRLKYLTPQVTVGIVVTPSKYYVEEGPDAVPAPRGFNVKPGGIDHGDMAFISKDGNRLHSKSIIRAGDLVAVRTGQPGTTAVVDSTLDGANCVDLIIIRQSPRFESRFLCHFLNSAPAHHQYGAGSEGALQQHFNVETAKELLISLPPRPEQAALVANLDRRLEEHDRVVAAAERQRDLLREYRQALISAAVTGKIEISVEEAA